MQPSLNSQLPGEASALVGSIFQQWVYRLILPFEAQGTNGLSIRALLPAAPQMESRVIGYSAGFACNCESLWLHALQRFLAPARN